MVSIRKLSYDRQSYREASVSMLFKLICKAETQEGGGERWTAEEGSICRLSPVPATAGAGPGLNPHLRHGQQGPVT